jgi:WD40 repeat protein
VVPVLLAAAPAFGQIQTDISRLPSHPAHIAFSPDGKQLATATRVDDQSQKALVVWEVASGKQLYQLGPYRRGCRWVAYSPDGKRLVSAE